MSVSILPDNGITTNRYVVVSYWIVESCFVFYLRLYKACVCHCSSWHCCFLCCRSIFAWGFSDGRNELASVLNSQRFICGVGQVVINTVELTLGPTPIRSGRRWNKSCGMWVALGVANGWGSPMGFSVIVLVGYDYSLSYISLYDYDLVILLIPISIIQWHTCMICTKVH